LIVLPRGLGPDFGFTSDDKECDLDYIHRRTPEADVYFVSNKREQWQKVTCSFRISGRTPQLWLPDTGEIVACSVAGPPSAQITPGAGAATSGVTQVPLELGPFGSVFVVFREVAQPLSAESGSHTRSIALGSPRTPGGGGPTGGPSWAVEGPWRVEFPPGWGAPAARTFPRLISWTEDADEGVKYFSGVATYRKTLDLTPEQFAAGKRLVLDLGRVRFVAEVYLNGQSLGILWKPPFTLDITEAAQAGANELVVEVANTWSNRLVGDAKTPGRDYCRTNIAKSLTWTLPWAETSLLESGLLGPVRLMVHGE
jgi:hypothetical protein